MTLLRTSSRSTPLFEHDLFRKTLPTFPDHAPPRRSSDEPLPLVDVELHSAFISHFQQQRLASFLIRDIRTLHYFEDLERLFAKRAQNFLAILQHFHFPLRIPIPGLRRFGAARQSIRNHLYANAVTRADRNFRLYRGNFCIHATIAALTATGCSGIRAWLA